MRKILTSLALVATSLAFAQVSIAPGEVTPKATLDIEAIGGNTADGILIPRVSRDRAWRMENIEESTLIYVKQINGEKSGKTSDVDAEGFYYFKGGKWVKLGGGASSGAGTDTSIYNTDGTLSGNRQINIGDNKLSFGVKSDSQENTGEVEINTTLKTRGALYVGTLDNAPYVTETSKGFRKFTKNRITKDDYKKDDYMIILTNDDLYGHLILPDADKNVGRIIWLINATTGSIDFKAEANNNVPFNYPGVPNSGSVAFISDGTTWYPLGR